MVLDYVAGLVGVREQGKFDAPGSPEILIVSDDPAFPGPILDGMKTGLTVSILRDGQSLPQQLSLRKPDLILLDFNWPTKDGIALCKQLKASADTEDIPVMLMLANDELDRRAAGFQAGAVDYLIKPLVPEEVTAKLRLHVEQPAIPNHRSRGDAEQVEQQLSTMRYMADRLHDAVYLVDSECRIRYVNNSACEGLGYSRDELLGMALPDIDPNFTLEQLREIGEAARGQGLRHLETSHRRKDGGIFPVEIRMSTVTYQGQSMGLSVVRDISERKRIEEERRSHLHYFEYMDRVNRAIQRSHDLEAMLSDVLDEVLAIFDCDRAFLIYPCDPNAEVWQVPMESARPEYPGALALGLDMAMDEGIEATFRIVLDADGPVTFGPGNRHALPKDRAEQFGFQSLLAKALYPKGDKPWQLGIHQCSRTRVWTAEEIKLFRAIARRLADGLSSLLAYRALQASEWEYRTLVDNIPLSLARYDVQGRITYFNPPLEKLLRMTTAEVCGKRPTECFSDPYYQDYEQKLLQVAASGEMVSIEWQGPGEESLEEGIITIVAERDRQGSVNGVLAIGQTLTALRRAEISLKKSEALHRSMVSAMIEGVIVQSRDGEILSINPAAEKILGLSADPARARGWLDMEQKILGEDGRPFPEDRRPSRMSLRTGAPQFDVEMGLCGSEGRVIWISVNTQPLFEYGKCEPYAVISTFHDITDEKRAEADRLKVIAVLEENQRLLAERLRGERRLSRMADHIPGFLYTFKVDANGHGCFPYVSEGIKDIYGLQPEDVLEDITPMLNMAHPDDGASLNAAIAMSVANLTSFHYEFRICHPGKGVLWLEAKAMPTVEDDGIVFHGFMQDITERKRIEQTLQFIAQSGWQESREAFLVSLADFLGQMLEVDYVLIDKLSTDLSFAETVVVYYRGEILPNMRYRLAGTPCDNVMAGTLCCYPEQVQQQFPEDTLLADMRVESYAGMPLRDSADNTLGLIAVMDGKPMVDSNRVTSILQLVAIRIAAELERDRFERALAESRQFYRQVIDTIAEPVFVKNRRHRWILVNEAFSRMIGRSQQYLVGKSDYYFFSREEADVFWDRDEHVFRSGEEDVNEEDFTDRNGITHSIVTKKTRYIDDSGEAVLVGIIMDVTDRKQMEATIRRREEEFRTLAENLPDVVVRYDNAFRRIYINNVYSKMLKPLGVDILGKTPQEYWRVSQPDADEFTRILQRIMETGQSETTLIQAETREGRMIYWMMNLVPEFDQEGRVMGVLTYATDITELKEYQREVEASRAQLRALAARSEKLREDERKYLARELHDDLGQRLTALKLDLARLMLRFGQNNPDLRRQVEEMELDMAATIQIVRGVATSLRPSALEMGIVSALEWLAHEFSRHSYIPCRLRIAKRKLTLDDNQAIALFRIVQESLTNVMRYAMASNVEIILWNDGNHYVLEISDDGVGFDTDEKRKEGSFGLIGIEERALSLGGDMRIDTAPDKGLKLIVRIPVYHANGEEL